MYSSNLSIIVFCVALIISCFVPYYGYKKKQKKGLVFGCLMQPVVFFLLGLFLTFIAVKYDDQQFSQEEDASMAILRYTENGDCIVSQTWILNPNGKCTMVFDQSPATNTEYPCNTDHFVEEYTITALDSFACEVDRRVKVCFDLQRQKVIAIDRIDTLEVVSVSWEKVRDFFSKEREKLS